MNQGLLVCLTQWLPCMFKEIHQIHTDLRVDMSKKRIPTHQGDLKVEMVLMEEITT